MLILAGLGLHGRGGSARLRALQRGCWGGQRDYALVLHSTPALSTTMPGRLPPLCPTGQEAVPPGHGG